MHSFIFEHRFWHDSSSNHVHSSARLVRNQDVGNVHGNTEKWRHSSAVNAWNARLIWVWVRDYCSSVLDRIYK